MRSSRAVLVALLAIGLAPPSFAQEPPGQPVPPGVPGQETAPPGAEKKGGLPPGLAARFGESVPEKAWIAFQPDRDDGAWFLIEGEWMLMAGFSAALRAEVREARRRPASVPPVPPPKVGVKLHVVLFE
jgi:hypothetical protein